MVPTAWFKGSSVPPHERLAAFAALTPGYDPTLAGGIMPEEFEVECRAWLLDDLLLTANHITAMELRRTEAHLQQYNRDTYTVVLLQKGSWVGNLDFGSVRIGAGEVCIMDFAVPWHVEGTEQDNVMLVVPRAVMTEAAPDAPRLHGRTLVGASGRLFAEHLLALARHLPEMNEHDIPFVRNATIALLTSALAALPQKEPQIARSNIRSAPIAAIRTFIDRNLTDPDLGAALICQRFAVTRPTLYRAFKDSGGVASYVQRRRLEAAHAQVSDPTDTRRLAEIADEFCFSSPAHFSTAFRRRFGYAPRDKRHTVSHVDAGTLFQLYRRQLGDPAEGNPAD